ncbi:MAG: filamentous hemagglutinin N-terminal domain-containing protein [Verrucomicrobiota bacterium]|nr:filamentous hemagglutinin N-terminal domain-containing protein [Verrucomicrobiota bacterium]
MRAFIFLVFPLSLLAIPAGEKLVHGQVQVERPSSSSVQITQSTPQAIVEWDSFSLGTQESAHFVQPDASAAILNRVVGGNLSEIYGQLQGNGQVFLINPNGVLVGPSGMIDCAAFLGAALNLENQPFLDGHNYEFTGNPEATLVNQGTIRVGNGFLFLVGPNLTNEGRLIAHQENVHLVEGEQITIDSLHAPKVMIRPAEAAFKGDQKEISKTLKAEPASFAINCEGRKEATVVRKMGSRVFLVEETPFTMGKVAHSTTSIWDNPTGTNAIVVENSLDAQQQLRTLIPERLWDQEFAVLVDVCAFEKSTVLRQTHRRRDRTIPSFTSIGESEYYLLRSTTSGELIRMGDRYLEFLDSPYWKTPEAEYLLPYKEYGQ